MGKSVRSFGPGLFVLLLFFLAGAGAAQELVTTQIDLEPGDLMGLDEVAYLKIKISVEGARVPNIPDPVFELENFRRLGPPSQSTGLVTVNGRPSASRTLVWELMPRKIGTSRVHSVSVTIEGQRIAIEDREIKVVRQAPTGRQARQRDLEDPFDRLRSQDPFGGPGQAPSWRRPQRRFRVDAPKILLEAEISPRSPYVGQQTIYTLNLYTQVDIKSVNPEEFPEFKGFWVQVIPQPDQQPEMVRYKGESFGRVVLIERALFPRRAGTFEIAPIAARMLAELPDSGPYGSLLSKSREIVRQSNKVRIRVRELPEPPPGFQGAVGSVSLSADLAPHELEVGEAATLTLTFEGRGHLQGIQAPQLPEIPGVRVFPPQQQSEEGLRGKNVYSSRTWSFVLVPERPGEWRLPTVEIPYFDPRLKRYESASSQPLSLLVKAATSAARLEGAAVELHSIRTHALPAVGESWDATALTPWLLALPGALGALLFLFRRRLAGGERPARHKLLAGLAGAAAEDRPRRAAATIEEAWREFLHERWQIPTSAPSTRWGRLLVERGANDEGAEDLVKLADDLHYLRYAPKLSSITELREELLERSRKLARLLS